MEAAIAAAVTTDRARAMGALANHLRAQGDAVCEALEKTEQQLEEATKQLQKTEEQLEAAKEVEP
jgi:hypothetical protein